MGEIGEYRGPWVIERKISEGGAHNIYRAHHYACEAHKAALKIPKSDTSIRRLQLEATTLASIQHPNIISIYDMSFDSAAYLALELGDCSLRAKVKTDWKQATTYTAQILQGLRKLHSKGIYHRDLKPDNIIIAKDTAKIADFDLAKIEYPYDRLEEIVQSQDLINSIKSMRKSLRIVGTIPYMAPEQKDGRQVTEKTDIYAVGIILYELLTGIRPEGRFAPASTISGSPEWLDAIIDGALNPDPAARITVKGFINEIMNPPKVKTPAQQEKITFSDQQAEKEFNHLIRKINKKIVGGKYSDKGGERQLFEFQDEKIKCLSAYGMQKIKEEVCQTTHEDPQKINLGKVKTAMQRLDERYLGSGFWGNEPLLEDLLEYEGWETIFRPKSSPGHLDWTWGGS